MLEQFILGILQGIAEWLPVSSEGLIVLAEKNIFKSTLDFESLIALALFLHLGTFLAALIYFRNDVFLLTKGFFQFQRLTQSDQKILIFLIISTIISGGLGIALIKLISGLADETLIGGKFITVLIGFLLLGTGYLELKARAHGLKNFSDLKIIDGIILGITQGFAALPGFSRSGLTISVLLLRKFDKACALKLSFLMSLPIVLGGNIVLNSDYLTWNHHYWAGLLASFVFGLLTIHVLLKIADKINFGYFVLFFGVLTLLSVLI